MTVKPKIIYLVTFGLLAVILSLPLQSALIYQNNFSELSEIFSKVSRLNWIMAGVLAVTAYTVYHVSPLLKVFVPLAMLAVGWNNYVVGSYQTDFSLQNTLIGTGLFSLLFVPLLRKDVVRLLNNPKLRWWDRPTRHSKRVNVTLHPYAGTTLQLQTYDISQTGAFISFDEQLDEIVPKVGESVKLSLNVSQLKKIRCDAVVVRVVEAKGTYPKGIGVKFTSFGQDQKKNLSQFLGH